MAEAVPPFGGANRAYLTASAIAPVLDINTLNGERGTLNGEVYNLNGQRVSQPNKGLYIVNGKTMIVK